MIKVIDELSTLTTIEKSTFLKLIDKVEWCIANEIEDSIINGRDIAEIDLGFGVLSIKIGDKDIKYKFKPSQKMDKTILNTIINERNDLVINIEKSLVSKLNNIYKTLL